MPSYATDRIRYGMLVFPSIPKEHIADGEKYISGLWTMKTGARGGSGGPRRRPPSLLPYSFVAMTTRHFIAVRETKATESLLTQKLQSIR
jgi:hypothetical protein